jgi:RNA polymerase sigma factor (sigma-70 family)
MVLGATIMDHVRDRTDQTCRYGTLTAAELLAGIHEGDPLAWEEVIRRYDRCISIAISSYRLQPADALDARQMTWLRLAENHHRVQHPEHLSSWLATTARRECLVILRQARRTPVTEKAQFNEVIDEGAGPEQRIVATELARQLWNLVDELPPGRKELMKELFSDSPRPYADIARSVRMPPGSIGPTRVRILGKLRRTLENKGLGRDVWW